MVALRPAALSFTLVTFLGYELFSPDHALVELVVVSAIFLALTPGLHLVGRLRSLALACRLSLVCDSVLIALAMSFFPRPEPGAIGFVWTIFGSGFLLTPSDTLALTAVAVAASAIVPAASVPDVQWVNVVSDVLALSLAGLLLALLGRQSRVYERRLSAAHRRDRLALDLATAVGLPREVWGRLGEFAGALGDAVGADEVSISAPGEDDGPLSWRAREPTAASETLRRRITSRPGSGLEIAVRGSGAARSEADALLDRVAPQLAATLAEAELLAEHDAARRRLEELAALREELVARVSHELRTPLTSIVGFLATLRRPDLDLDEAQRRRYLEIAEQEAQRLGRLVDDVLSVTRERAQRLTVGRFAVSECCREAAALVSLGGTRTVDLELDDGLEVVADRDRFMQILANLLENSRRHGRGRTIVRCCADGDGVRLSVSDDGPGVEPGLLPTLFEPFASGGRAGDTGLGLAVARSLAEAHGGSLVYEPPEPGARHAFVLRLPHHDHGGEPAG